MSQGRPGQAGKLAVRGRPCLLPPAVARSASLDSESVMIHHETFGQGEPVVLVHGWGSNLRSNWVGTNWVETLQPGRRVVALDCRGHGQSDKPHDPEVYSYENMAQDVLRLMDHLDIAKADLFGYSMGAMIGTYMLTQPGHRDRFSSMVLGGNGHAWLFPDTGGEVTRVIADGLLAEEGSQVTDPEALGYRAWAEADPNNDLRALAASMLRLGDPIEPAALADVDIPVLIINGANDNLIGDPEILAAAIPGARAVSIPDTDHLSVVPDPRFKQEVLAFLEAQ